MAQGSQPSREVAIRKEGEARNWYVIGGYVAGGLLGSVFLVWSFLSLWAQSTATYALALLLLLIAGTVVSFVSLFKDSAYLRRTTADWNPKWWYYIGVPFVVSMAISLLLSVSGYGEAAPATGMAVFTVTSVLSNGHYLYTRHRYVGVP